MTTGHKGVGVNCDFFTLYNVKLLSSSCTTAATTLANDIGLPIVAASQMRVLVSVSAAPAANTDRTFRLLKNGVDVGAIRVITPASALTCDTTVSVAYASLDTVTVVEYNTGSANGNASDVKIAFIAVP